jgi:hypothetical protein
MAAFDAEMRESPLARARRPPAEGGFGAYAQGWKYAPGVGSEPMTLAGIPVVTSRVLVESDTSRTVKRMAPDWRRRMARNYSEGARPWIDRHGRSRGRKAEPLEMDVHPMGPSPNVYIMEGARAVLGHPETVAKMRAALCNTWNHL